jgi:hypothetical protein
MLANVTGRVCQEWRTASIKEASAAITLRLLAHRNWRTRIWNRGDLSGHGRCQSRSCTDLHRDGCINPVALSGQTALIGTLLNDKVTQHPDALLQLRWFQSTYIDTEVEDVMTHSCVNDLKCYVLKRIHALSECRIGYNDVSLLYAIASPQWCKKTLSVSHEHL